MTGGDGDQDSADFELLFEMDGTAQSVSCMRCGVNYQAGNTLTVPVPALASLGITNPITLTVDTVATVNGVPGVITGVSVSSKWPDPIVILPTWHVSTTALNADLLFDFSKVRTYYDNVMKGTQTDAGLALADFRAGSQTWFRQWDANGDGKLVKDELTADMPRDGSSCVRQATLKCPKGKQLVDGAMKKANVCEACPSGKFSNADDDKPCGLHTVTGWATVASGAVCGSSWNIPELINMPNSGVKNFGPKTLDACKQACVDLGAECGAISHGNGATDRLVQSCFLHRTQTLTDRTYQIHGGVSLTGYTCLHRVHNCAPGKGLQKGTASADGVCISCGAGAVCIDTRASGSGLEGDDNRGSYTNGVSSQCEYFKSKNQCGTVGEGAWGAACLKTCGLCVASWDFSAADDDKPCSTFTPSCGVGLGVVAGTATASVDRQCETCPPGKFSTADDANACVFFTVVKCGVGLGTVAGTATASVDRQCGPCPTGKFSAADDVNACGSFTVAKCGVGEGVVAGTATASADRQCGPCPSGKFSAVLDATACGPHTTVQTGCPVGKQLVAGTASTDIACATCPSGKFSASNDPSLCEPYTVASCAVGKGMPNANPSTEDRVCIACASGKYSQRDNATPCYSHAVTKCIPGKELSAGTDAKDGACAPCGVGKFSAADDAEKCVSYVGPVKCVAGKELVPGSSSKDRICQTCPSGRMSTTDDDAACQAHAVADCIAGKGMLTVGTPTVDGVCIACSPGQFSAAVDTNGCAGFTVTTCPKGAGVASGTATPTTDRECRLCNSGTFSATADDQACKSYTVGACLPGKGLSVATAASDRSCSPCAPGTFSAANDANVCTSYTGPSSCALGEGLQYSATSNRACVPCAGGSFSAANDGNTCVPHTVTNCGAGKGLSKGSVTADGVCAPCGPGNFNAFYDDNGCAAFAGPTQCPAGAGLFSGSASADRSCT